MELPNLLNEFGMSKDWMEIRHCQKVVRKYEKLLLKRSLTRDEYQQYYYWLHRLEKAYQGSERSGST